MDKRENPTPDTATRTAFCLQSQKRETITNFQQTNGGAHKKTYIAPKMTCAFVELEGGFMQTSQPTDEEIFNNNGHDMGVSIEGHGVGNTGDYTDIGWDEQSNF